jgi:hypothetical protein
MNKVLESPLSKSGYDCDAELEVLLEEIKIAVRVLRTVKSAQGETQDSSNNLLLLLKSLKEHVVKNKLSKGKVEGYFDNNIDADIKLLLTFSLFGIDEGNEAARNTIPSHKLFLTPTRFSISDSFNQSPEFSFEFPQIASFLEILKQKQYDIATELSNFQGYFKEIDENYLQIFFKMNTFLVFLSQKVFS